MDTNTNTAKKIQSDLTRNNGGTYVYNDNTGNVLMVKDETKEEEITKTKESWKDSYVKKEFRYHAVTISKTIEKEKTHAWFLDEN